MTDAVQIIFPDRPLGVQNAIDTIAELRALDSTEVNINTEVLVASTGFYKYDPSSLAADDGSAVIKPDDLTVLQAGRWEIVLLAAAGLSSYTAAGAGGLTSDVQAKLRQMPAVADYDTVAHALASRGLADQLLVTADASAGTTAPTNPGAELLGEHALYYTPASGGGRRVINHAGRDAALLQFGQECLVRWNYGLYNGDTLAGEAAGDSNSTPSFVGGQIAFLLGALPRVTITNDAIGGTSLEDWRTGTNEYAASGKAMADVIGRAPQLILICFGTNDAVDGRTPAQFKASLDAALTTIRATLSVQATSICLFTPNSMNGPAGDDELYSAQIRAVIRQAAIDFQCAFFDKGGRYPDAFVDFGTGTSQNHWLDTNRVHADTIQRDMLVWEAFRFLVPPQALTGNFMWQTARVATDLPITYRKEMSSERATTGFPVDGGVVTFNPLSTAGHFPLQLNWSISSGSFHIRGITATNTWSNWTSIGIAALATDVLADTAAITSYPRGDSAMRVTAAGWPLNGYVLTRREPNSATGPNGYQDLFDASADAPTQRRVYAGGAWGVWRRLSGVRSGTATFSAATTVAVVLSPAEPDTNYKIVLTPAADPVGRLWFASKATGGFTITNSSSTSIAVDWAVVRS